MRLDLDQDSFTDKFGAVDLEGTIAIVTGASRGVGAATARALGAAGVRVACAARSTDAQPQSTPGTLDETVEQIRAAGGEAIAVPTNLAVESEVSAMVATTVATYGEVDILINNAAITFPGDLDLSMKRHELTFAVNLWAPLQAIRDVAPSMRERGSGSILNVSSVAALNYFPGLMSYGASKIALEHFTIDCATQLKPFGVAVNTFRIDIPVASEGFIANAPDLDHSDWEPSSVAAEGILWMLRQPSSYTGNNVGMAALRDSQGIMKSQARNSQQPMPETVTENPMRLTD